MSLKSWYRKYMFGYRSQLLARVEAQIKALETYRDNPQFTMWRWSQQSRLESLQGKAAALRWKLANQQPDTGKL